MATTLPAFDKAKPFYPLVLNYLTLVHGFMDLVVHGVLRAFPLSVGAGQSRAEGVISLLKPYAQGGDTDAGEMIPRLEKLTGPIQLVSAAGDVVEVDRADLALRVQAAGLDLMEKVMASASSLLIIAHETTDRFRQKNKVGWQPMWQFLKHARHAAAHGGVFTFEPGQPRHPAKWRNLEILSAMQGSPLFRKGAAPGFIMPGDPIHLLYDIEQAYPQLT